MTRSNVQKARNARSKADQIEAAAVAYWLALIKDWPSYVPLMSGGKDLAREAFVYGFVKGAHFNLEPDDN